MDILDVSRSTAMITVTSVEAQTRFGELIDRSQREPVAITRRGRTVAYVVSAHEMRELEIARRRPQNQPVRKVSELLAMPVDDDGEFDVPRSRDLPRPADLF
jgi:prevent-host-death family protein